MHDAPAPYASSRNALRAASTRHARARRRWIGTGRCLFSLDFKDADYAAVQQKLLAAAAKMSAAGWWWEGATAQRIKNAILLETLYANLVPSFLKEKPPPASPRAV